MAEKFSLATRNLADSMAEVLESFSALDPHPYANSSALFENSASSAVVVSTSVTGPALNASAFHLALYAERRLTAILRQGSVAPSSAHVRSVRRVLKHYVADEGPTPQVAPTSAGMIEIQWVSGGVLVSALFDDDGSYNLYGAEDQGAVLFDVDVEAGNDVPSDLKLRVVAVLAKMGATARNRPAFWL